MGARAKKLAEKLIDDLLSRDDESFEEKSEGRNAEKNQHKSDFESSGSPLKRVSHSQQSVESFLGPSEGLRLAQEKVLKLEQEIQQLKKENVDLFTAGEIFKDKTEDLSNQLKSVQSEYEQTKGQFDQEKEVLLNSLDRKKKEIEESKKKADIMGELISSKMQKIQHTEQDLENRLEIMKKEADVLLKSKNKMILDLKRQINSINRTLDSYKMKGKELSQKLGDKQDVLKKTVKALHLTLSLLENS